MPVNELMLLHGIGGGSGMAARTAAYTSVYDPRTGTYVYRAKRRRRARTVGGLGTLGNFGQAAGLKGTLSSVKGVLITGSIAAGGAIITQQVFDKIAANWSIDGWKRDLAQMGTGIALGILIAKLLKKPKIGAAFAIGPVVAGAIRMFSDVMGSTAGLGLTAFTPVDAYSSMYAPLYGANGNGLGLNTYEAVGQPPGMAPPPLSSAVIAGAGL